MVVKHSGTHEKNDKWFVVLNRLHFRLIPRLWDSHANYPFLRPTSFSFLLGGSARVENPPVTFSFFFFECVTLAHANLCTHTLISLVLSVARNLLILLLISIWRLHLLMDWDNARRSWIHRIVWHCGCRLLLWYFCSGEFCVLHNFAFQLAIVVPSVGYIMKSYFWDIIPRFLFSEKHSKRSGINTAMG